MEIKGLQLNQSELNNLSKNIGKELSKLYDISEDDERRKRDSIGIKYAIKLKELDEVAIEFKQVYSINEDISDLDLNKLEYLSSDERLIYKNIQEGNNTINLLNKSYPDLNVLSYVRSLEEKNLIINTFSTNLTES